MISDIEFKRIKTYLIISLNTNNYRNTNTKDNNIEKWNEDGPLF